MEFLQNNLIAQIIMLVIGLSLIGIFGWRTFKKYKDKSTQKKSSSSSNRPKSGGLNI